MSARLGKYSLYELCVQTPARDVQLVRAMHGGVYDGSPAMILGDDFCGSSLMSWEWVSLEEGASAVATDRDPEAIAHVRTHPRVRSRCMSVMDVRDEADAICALNYAACELHARRDLVAYLAHARSRLLPGGVFVCDIYGGASAWEEGEFEGEFAGPGGERVIYTWAQESADPTTGMVNNAIHFGVEAGRERYRLERAFEYEWRLWSVAELREAMQDAGFARTEVFLRDQHGIDGEGSIICLPAERGDLGESYQVYVAAYREGE